MDANIPPVTWPLLAAGFAIAGLMHLARARRSRDRAQSRALLAASCAAWAAASLLIWRGMFSVVWAAMAIAIAAWVLGALASLRTPPGAAR